MTAVAVSAASANATEPAGLEAEARALAEAQHGFKRVARLLTRVFAPPPLARPLERAERFLSARSSGDAALERATEWFLDNYYLIRRVARQVEEELPRGFVRHLPQLASGRPEGKLRIDALAHLLVEKSDMMLDISVLHRFVGAYQEVSPLTIAELWALPTMLRATVLEELLRSLHKLNVPVHSDDRRILHTDSLGLSPGTGVERSIRALRALDTIDWTAFFTKVNCVEAILRTDPADVYARMDFETCDTYRKVVETIAWGAGRTEKEVADLTVLLAREHTLDERRGHVGYYLVAAGRSLLEARMGYRPHGLERVRRVARAWPTASYLLPLALLTTLPLLALAWCLPKAFERGDLHLLSTAALVAAAIVPASAVAIAVIQSVFAWLLPPATLPKLDFTKGLPGDTRTLVVVPTLLGRADDVGGMLRDIELHYLSNPDPQLQFALLTDDEDAKTPKDADGERTLLESASRGIEALNAKHGNRGHGPFHLLHREPRWNPAEERFMGLGAKTRQARGSSIVCSVATPKRAFPCTSASPKAFWG